MHYITDQEIDRLQGGLAARVHCALQGWGALTFSAKKLPTMELEVNLLIMG
ncbi:MAG: hypothetical protein LBN26_04600 [Christensenellaceae bacterium]|jgi:hypothetical protein|nr:hypothetical protein [Christensenellaceae bacterium]